MVHQMIALSIIHVCPPNEIEALIPVLLRVFNTRHPLLELLKAMIDREVASTGMRYFLTSEPLISTCSSLPSVSF
jgi:hypothetical protein